MNKAELKAMLIIAEKMNWYSKPVMEVCETIKQMVRNQQALELDTVGECDGDEETLLRSISEKLFSLPDDTVVFPGHDEQTTIATEKKYNFYF